MIRLAATLLVIMLLSACTTTREGAREAEASERQFPTTVKTVDGRALHPKTGKPVDCELMAPFEDRVPELKDFSSFIHGWHHRSLIEIVGWGGYLLHPSYNPGVIRQGIAMSRACRALPLLSP